MERNNGPRNFQPRKNQMYQKKFPQQEPRIPNQLDSTNLVDEEFHGVDLVSNSTQKVLAT